MKKEDFMVFIVFFIFVGLLPLFIESNYALTIGIFSGINALVAIGLCILMGYAGQVSLGQAGFYGIGAYVSSILSVYYGFPVILGILSAMIVSAIAAVVLAVPALRLKGHYLAVATLGFGEIIYVILNEWGPGGPSGFGDIPHFNIAGYSIQTTKESFYFIWIIVAIVMLYSINLTKSNTGRILRAMHDSDTACEAIGINVPLLKIKVFILSALYASLAGSLYSHYVTFISPSSFSLFYSILILMMVIVGGSKNLWGAVAGAIVITVLPELLRKFQELDILVYGFILTLTLMFFRKGLVPIISEKIKNVRGYKFAKH
ncbi:MAG: branched-chain amino acid ABC transporter permease [Nitrospirae bacterium]|jgi:branched-chain amino acid transport system permease protein|nr:branched-chain amino acid ABC transporter permease [Nitrospirota bacterium]